MSSSTANTYEITCKNCGNVAIKKRKNAKYCGDPCRQRAYEKRSGKKTPEFVKRVESKKAKRKERAIELGIGSSAEETAISTELQATQSNLTAWKAHKTTLQKKFEKISNQIPGKVYEDWATAAGTIYGLSKTQKGDGLITNSTKTVGAGILFKIASRGIIDAIFKDTVEKQKASKLRSLQLEISNAQDQISILEISVIGLKKKKSELSISAAIRQFNKQEQNKTSPTIKTADSYKKEIIETLGFKNAYQYLIGDPAANFYAVLTGESGNGKSTFAVQFANYFQSNHGKVLLMAAEQRGMNKPLQQLLRRYDAKFDIETEPHKWKTEKWIEAANAYSLIIVDSATNLGLAPEQIENIRANAPKTGFLVILQSTKEGNYKGSTEWKHNCDIFLKADSMKIYQTKSRYSKPAHIELTID